MTLPTSARKDRRGDVAKCLQDNLVGTGSDKPLAAVFDHLAKDFGGLSPVVTLENGPLPKSAQDPKTKPQEVILILGLWSLRDVDASAAEDVMDDAGVAILSLLHTYFLVTSEGDSQPDYDMVGALEYRVEFFFLKFRR